MSTTAVFQPEHDGTLSIESAVFQALGAASVCWESMSGTGIFNDTRAKAIGDALLEHIRSKTVAVSETEREWLLDLLSAEIEKESGSRDYPTASALELAAKLASVEQVSA